MPRTYRLDSTRFGVLAVCQLCAVWRELHDHRDAAQRAVALHHERVHPGTDTATRAVRDRSRL